MCVMERIYNFSAGPAVLPQEVLEQARDEMLDWQGSGMSVMEMSHRGKEFMGIAAQAEADLRDLLDISAHYKVLFLQGGASSQFAMVPMNLLCGRRSADYVNTGEWSGKAINEARKYCAVNIAATSEDANFSYAPSQDGWRLDPAAAYVHYTPNETIGGVEFHWVPDTGAVPLVADMSSNILSRPIDVSRYGLIGETLPGTPTMFDYKIHADNGSMYNTPPTYSMYVAGLVFRWLKRNGGLAEMERRNIAKAALLYDALDEDFLKQAKARGLVQLKGHRLVGGMRASIYNAMPVEGVQVLVQFMKEFEKQHG